MLKLENNGYRLVKQKSGTGSESYALTHLVFGDGTGELKSCIVYVCVEEIATGKKCRLAAVVKENVDWVVISQPVSNGKFTRVMIWDWDSSDPGYTIPALKRLCLAICKILPRDEEQLLRWFREITGVQFHVAVATTQLRMPVAKTTKNLDHFGASGFRDLLYEWVNKYLIPTWGQRATPRFVFETPDYEIVERESSTGQLRKLLLVGDGDFGRRIIIRVREKSTGREINLYQSWAGTSGKQAGAWYVTGGLSRASIGGKLWIIKGYTDECYGAEGRKELCDLCMAMNKILPRDETETDFWLREFIGMSSDDLNAVASGYQARTYPYKGKMDDEGRRELRQIWKDQYLTPVWGKRDLERNPNPGVPRNFDINKYIMFYRQSDPMRAVVPRIQCASGLSLSVQAGPDMYSFPRTWEGPWVSVEVGFPSRFVPALKPYGEDFTESENVVVYHNVPVSVVNRIIDQNGGIIG